ncbi:MAG TPA: hypothetical protein VFW92_07765 [Candidatus Limnocylindrales bacterium]|nr:hypothetical protein [Candidatus Limnocylindrales bacterium]
MFTFKIPRFFSFVALVGAMVALVGATVLTTGAYFTDSHAGQYTGTFGEVSVAVDGHGSGAGHLQLDWDDMLPGAWNASTLTVKNTGSANESIWLVFDNSNLMWSSMNTLGTYGEWYVNGHDYDNLNNRDAQGTPANPGQHNACGDPTPAIAYLPHVNTLGTLAPGATANYSVKFRYTACLSDPALQGLQAFAQPIQFAIVATQNGILPNDPHNGAGTIPDLTLPVPGNDCPGVAAGQCDGTYQ